MDNITEKDILKFWFEETASSMWWKKDDDFDNLIKNRFLEIHSKAARCELVSWRHSAEGRLAEIIILDQFSRNMFRNTAQSFDCDSLALVLAQEAVNRVMDFDLTPIQRSFMYLPYMHSESLFIHERAVELYTKNNIKSNLEFELKHKVIIEKFGRYPHRNLILGRKSTKEELLFLEQPDSGF